MGGIHQFSQKGILSPFQASSQRMCADMDAGGDKKPSHLPVLLLWAREPNAAKHLLLRAPASCKPSHLLRWLSSCILPPVRKKTEEEVDPQVSLIGLRSEATHKVQMQRKHTQHWPSIRGRYELQWRPWTARHLAGISAQDCRIPCSNNKTICLKHANQKNEIQVEKNSNP